MSAAAPLSALVGRVYGHLRRADRGIGVDDVMTVMQARQRLRDEYGIDKSTAIIRRLCQHERIAATKPGNEWLITTAGFRQLIEHFSR